MRNIFIIIYILFSTLSFSQDKVELLNEGNEYFLEGDFKNAEDYYKKSLQKDSKYYKANLNAGHSLYRQALQNPEDLKKCENAELYYNKSVKLAKTKNEKSESLYNLGNTHLLSQKLESSIENYKESLRLDPGNMDAKHNLALAQYLLNKKNSGGGGDGEKNQDSPKDSEKASEEDQGEENNQQNQSKEGLSKEEMDQILNTLKRKEEKVQKDLQEIRNKEKEEEGNKEKKKNDW